MSFLKKTKSLKLFVIPNIAQRLILGVDFWKAFDLLPDFVGSVGIVCLNNKSNCPSDLSEILEKSAVQSETRTISPFVKPTSTA